ncbi:putative skeletal organic matrix protein 5 [Exaiptasia diaphana]|nr:putative skeletal organic matrix protein 5 [Exaiptasia diaphana]
MRPSLGDVPEKAASSCKEILEQRRQAQDGAYYLQASPSYKVYCQMTPISDCGDEGGWTLVMKINGSKGTFRFSERYWKEQDAYYQEKYGGDLSEKETKLKTFQLTSFDDMCLGMKTLNDIKWVKIALKRGQQNMEMFPIFQKPYQFGFKEISKEKWEGLVESNLDDTQTDSGSNIRNDKAKVRIGILASKSYIGFGTGGAMGNISCGYVRTDTKQVQPTFGYILIR